MTERNSPLAVVPTATPGHGLLAGNKVVVTADAVSPPPAAPLSRVPTCWSPISTSAA